MRRNLKNVALILVLMFILVGIVACSSDNGQEHVDSPDKDVVIDGDTNDEPDQYPLEIEDAFGNKVTIERAPERIVSLAPNNTEILFALGLGEKIVGVTAFCDYPEEALSIEKIGDYIAVNFEKVIELEPDLIVNYGELDPDAGKIYSDANIPVICYMPESIDEVIETINQIAIATDAVKEGNTLTNNMIQKRDEIIAKVKDTETIKVFYEIWHEPLQAAGKGSFIDGLIELANGENIARDAEDEYPIYDIEQLIENDPQVYLTASDIPEKTVETISKRPGYEGINAIKNGKIYLLDGNILSRSGPRIVEALEIIAQTIHPEAFE